MLVYGSVWVPVLGGVSLTSTYHVVWPFAPATRTTPASERQSVLLMLMIRSSKVTRSRNKQRRAPRRPPSRPLRRAPGDVASILPQDRRRATIRHSSQTR